jgi:hypothetical protein
MSFCLPRNVADKLKSDVVSGAFTEQHLQQLAGLSTEARRTALADIVGKENAQAFNTEFESKLILKYQKTALLNLIDKTTGTPPKVKATLVGKVNKLTEALIPDKNGHILKDLVDTKLGINVTDAEAKQIADLGRATNEAKAVVDKALSQDQAVSKSGHQFTDPATREAAIKYGAAKAALEDFVGKQQKAATQRSALSYLNPLKVGATIKDILGSTKAMVTFSLQHTPLRHDFFALFRDPKDWATNYVKSWRDFFQQSLSKDPDLTATANKAQIYSRPNYLNGNYQKLFGNQLIRENEEFHLTPNSNLPGRVPVLGRIFYGSRAMFESMNLNMRADLGDFYINLMQRAGQDINDPAIAKGWGRLAMDMTGGESTKGMGRYVLFSERLLKAQLRNLTLHIFDSSVPLRAKFDSAQTLATAVTSIGILTSVVNSLRPGTIETDPRSANFGKIKIGDTRFDISGGTAGLINLGVRLGLALTNGLGTTNIPNVKSSTTGKLSTTGTGFGQTSVATLLGDFLEGRAAPVGSLLFALANGSFFGGAKLSVIGALGILFEPIPLQDWTQLKNDPNSANMIMTMILNGLGFLSNTYGSTKQSLQNAFGDVTVPDPVVKEIDRLQATGNRPTISDPTTSTSWLKLKATLGQSQYNQAIQSYLTDYLSKVQKLLNDPTYQSESDAQKAKDWNTIRAQAEKQAQSSVSYKAPKPAPANRARTGFLKSF